MRILGWVLLIAAFVCGVMWTGGMWLPELGRISASDIGRSSLYAGAPTQALGVYFLSRTGARGWPVAIGYLAAVLWAAALIAIWQARTGGGAMAIGFLVMLPAIAIATVLEAAALVGFARRK